MLHCLTQTVTHRLLHGVTTKSKRPLIKVLLPVIYITKYNADKNMSIKCTSSTIISTLNTKREKQMKTKGKSIHWNKENGTSRTA